ncbi:MAG: hypothetical protein Q8Q85_08255 [Gemmatimonadales bacterium]|nr:hypothetical protein [Gemmatimonadales bacterium]
MALARAYMRDAQVVILDEPTAALDARVCSTIVSLYARPTGSSSPDTRTDRKCRGSEPGPRA